MQHVALHDTERSFNDSSEEFLKKVQWVPNHDENYGYLSKLVMIELPMITLEQM